MDADNTVLHFNRLLELLPGVRIAWEQNWTNVQIVRIGLAISDQHSLAVLVHIAVASNVSISVDVDWGCRHGCDEPNCLRYDWRIPVAVPPSDPGSSMEFIGGLLASRLRDRGLLAAEEAARLRRAWHFAEE